MLTGDQIKHARQRAGLSQAELATRVGVSMRSIGNYERGETIPRNKMPVIEDALADYLPSADVTREANLREISDARLLAEIARRFERGSKEQIDDRPAPNARAGGSPADDLSARRAEPEQEERRVAAHPMKGRDSVGRRMRDHLDEIGEESQDTGADEPS